MIAAHSAETCYQKKSVLLAEMIKMRYKWLGTCVMETIDNQEDFYSLLDHIFVIKGAGHLTNFPRPIRDFYKKVVENKKNPYQLIIEGEPVTNKIDKLLWLNEYGNHNPFSTFCGIAILRTTDQNSPLYFALTKYFDHPTHEHFEIIETFLTIDLSLQNQRRDQQRIALGLKPFINMRVVGNKKAYDLVIEEHTMLLSKLFDTHALRRAALAKSQNDFIVEPMKCSKANYLNTLKRCPTHRKNSVTSHDMGRRHSLVASSIDLEEIRNVVEKISLRGQRGLDEHSEERDVFHLTRLASREKPTETRQNVSSWRCGGFLPELLSRNRNGNMGIWH